MKKALLNLLLLIAVHLNANSQTTTIADKIDAYNKSFPIEKIYLTLDKPYYSAGDTLWFKSYLLNADFTATKISAKIYVELFNDSLKLLDNKVIALNNGLGYGDFELSKSLPNGTYTIRAYSNWQQNFGDDYFFQKSIYIGNAQTTTWLFDSYQKFNANLDNNELDLKLRIKNINGEPAGLKDVELYLENGNKKISKANLQTKTDGTLETKIPISDKQTSGNYNVVISQKNDKSKRYIIPVILKPEDAVDLQFLPEGGHMVNGIYGKVAFKAVGSDGLGKEIQGKIVNSKNETLTGFKTTHKGMGSFFLFPEKGEIYSAVRSINGKEIKTTLPIAKLEGTTLRVDHLSNKDSLYIYVKASELSRNEGYNLLIQKDNELIFQIKLNLRNGFSTLKLPKTELPDGIIHFTLLSPATIPLNERHAFVNHSQNINLALAGNFNYTSLDSVALELSATDEKGTPLTGAFAVTVTDDKQVKQDEYDNNIISHFLLKSSVKGSIESSGWYFENNSSTSQIALDHLLLTQAWVGYNWQEITRPLTEPKFKAEKDNKIEGKVTGLFNKPLEGIKVNLLSLGREIMFVDTLTNASGKFSFGDIPLSDSVSYMLKIKNQKGKTATGTIIVDDFVRAKELPSKELLKPWYLNVDSTFLKNFKSAETEIKQKERAQSVRTGTLLNEVIIKGQARLKEIIVKNAWDAKFLNEITEEDLKKVPQKLLKDLLLEKFPNFNIGNFWSDSCTGRPGRHSFSSFRIGSALLSHVIIDKVNTNLVASGTDDNYQVTGTSLSSKAGGGIEPNYGPAVFEINNYIFNTLTASEITNVTLYRGCVYYYLDITTRGGKGPWITPTPGRYIFRPQPIYLAKEFYSPKYVNKVSPFPDNRSTIFWDANIVTDENGKAKISFYAADSPSTYTVKIEGTDLNGRFGFKKFTLTNSKPTAGSK
ncbi:hypothetical protein [Pedobacter namyangjuensis]|uniref:hypothetical protein n=1 Tax=Pedobacter namyangjuensis TaxID=600626 RepID=UPI000DE1EE11|nr:hypothetical protein [Pedobacter namyangjuensis]